MKSIRREDLKVGQLMITRTRQVNGGKFQLEFAEKVERPGQAPSLVSLLNASDSRFTAQGDSVRLAWRTGEKNEIESIFGVDLNSVTSDWSLVNQLVEHENQGYVLRLIVKDYTTPTANDATNIAKFAKNTGSENPMYFIYNKKFVFSQTVVDYVAKGTNPNHTIISVKDGGNFKANCALLPFEEAVAFCEGATVNAETKPMLMA